ncbi:MULTISPECIES: hypothetical protein [Streptomyces]|nr:hypothetical protein [Streptomyces murinus]MBA9050813.1 hypothetical protein [Streptomyces murinus]
MAYLDYIGGCGYGARPCLNCETEPAERDYLYCSPECRDEFEGIGAYAE